MTRILGISAFYHDSAACLVQDGKIVAAVQEERFSRIKHDSSFPSLSIRACLEIAGCNLSEIDYAVFYEKPFCKFERLLETYLDHSPAGLRSYLKAIPTWIKEKFWIKDRLRRELDPSLTLLFGDHHESHAASAFYPSPFKQAAILTSDGVGEWTTTSLGTGSGGEISLIKELRFPHSLGLLYSAFTYYLGFKVNSGEYKLMGLAPYGEPRFENKIRASLIDIRNDGSFHLNTDFLGYEVGLTMISKKFEELFEGPARRPSEPLAQKHKDLAASIQKVLEEVILKTVGHLYDLTGEKNLCMAGGVALNCVANGRVLREGPFQDLWVQPAAGDAGGALGAALAVWHRYLRNERPAELCFRDRQQGTLLGTEYSVEEIQRYLEEIGAVFQCCSDPEIYEATAGRLARGDVVGWFRGRMEFGPRALGCRSILADPRVPGILDEVNRRIKYRESFRPFAPAVLEEAGPDFFELDRPSPYMLLVAPVRENRRKTIPAVTHVDGSARIQTVASDTNPSFYRLLSEFKRISGCPVLLNTSFNVRGEPIVESPSQAYRCFMRTGLDHLVLENFLLSKSKQPTGI